MGKKLTEGPGKLPAWVRNELEGRSESSSVVIFSGTRHGADTKLLGEVTRLLLDLNPRIAVVGDARGVDAQIETILNSLRVDYVKSFADWDAFGKMAGVVRNMTMLDLAQKVRREGEKVILIALPCKHSKGTRSMIRAAGQRGIQVREFPSNICDKDSQC